MKRRARYHRDSRRSAPPVQCAEANSQSGGLLVHRTLFFQPFPTALESVFDCSLPLEAAPRWVIAARQISRNFVKQTNGRRKTLIYQVLTLAAAARNPRRRPCSPSRHSGSGPALHARRPPSGPCRVGMPPVGAGALPLRPARALRLPREPAPAVAARRGDSDLLPSSDLAFSRVPAAPTYQAPAPRPKSAAGIEGGFE
jgi:hypothetical protein